MIFGTYIRGIEFPVKAVITTSQLAMAGLFPVADKTSYFMLLCVCFFKGGGEAALANGLFGTST